MTSAGEDVDKREALCIVAGNVNLCSLCGKQYGASSEIKESYLMIQQPHFQTSIQRKNSILLEDWERKIDHFTHFQVQNSVALSTFTKSCDHHCHPFPQLSTPETLYPLNDNSAPPSPGPVTSILPSFSLNLPVLCALQKWNHTVFVLSCLALSLSAMFLMFIRTAVCIRISSKAELTFHCVKMPHAVYPFFF